MDGVVNDPPEPKLLPPVSTLYQLMVAPVVAEALKFTVPVPHLLPPVVPVILGLVKMVNVPPAVSRTAHGTGRNRNIG